MTRDEGNRCVLEPVVQQIKKASGIKLMRRILVPAPTMEVPPVSYQKPLRPQQSLMRGCEERSS